jgi:hypothetical protein
MNFWIKLMMIWEVFEEVEISIRPTLFTHFQPTSILPLIFSEREALSPSLAFLHEHSRLLKQRKA